MWNQPTLVDRLRYYDEQLAKFKVVTRLTVQDALDFYLATGRFPNSEETTAITTLGIERVITLYQLGAFKVTEEQMRTLITDVEKFNSARSRLADACLRVWFKIFPPK